MKCNVSVEFTEAELLSAARDLGNRLLFDLIGDIGEGLGRIDPQTLMSMFQSIISSVAGGFSGPPRGWAKRAPHADRPNGGPIPVGVPRSEAGPITRCFAIEGSRHMEPGIGCHVCATYNGLQRTEFRNCGHVLCVIRTPEPDASVPETTP